MVYNLCKMASRRTTCVNTFGSRVKIYVHAGGCKHGLYRFIGKIFMASSSNMCAHAHVEFQIMSIPRLVAHSLYIVNVSTNEHFSELADSLAELNGGAVQKAQMTAASATAGWLHKN